MENKSYKSILMLFLIMTISIVFFSFERENKKETGKSKKDLAPYNTLSDNLPAEKENVQLEGPDLEIRYFEDWHYPYGAELPKEVVSRIWQETKSMPDEKDLGDAVVNSWRMIGPYGSVSQTTGIRVSGRILDVEVGNTTNPLLATASGGLWGYLGFLPVDASEDVTSLAIGSVASYPGEPSTILIGTGEPRVRTGTGLWRTTNSGVNWTHIDISPDPGNFYRIRHQTFFANFVHAATSEGYYRSTDGGLTWTKYLDGNNGFGISDIAINPNNPNIIYAGKWNDGVYKSTNNGLNWAKVTTPGIPTSDIGRISLTIGTSNSNKIYTMMESVSGNNTLGIFMTANDGASWSDVTPTENVLGNQGWYDNVIGVCPTNSNIVLAGGVRLYRSTNSGTTWTKLTDTDIHADQHAIEWTADGNSVYIGNDGGVTYSSDQGVTFATGINYIPITQYVNFDVGESNRGVIYGGSQDNGITGTTNGGQTWVYTKGGDGGGIAVDPHSSLFVYSTAGAYSGNFKFRIFKSTDQGFTWDTNHTGLDPISTWYTKMRSDRTHPIKLYTNGGGYVYESQDVGETWSKMNVTPFPATISDLGVSKYLFPKAIIYATLSSSSSGTKIRVYEGGSFSERSSGIPTNLRVRQVVPHQVNTSTAYALINGFSDGNKVFKTTNRGLSWSNISGNLPDVPIGGLVPHRSLTNYLYLGTETGCYRTTNAGVSWHRWNNGMPDATIVTEMKWIDSTLENGKKYVIASTYGRSLWVREVSGDDPDNELSQTMLIQGFYNIATGRTVRDTVNVFLRSSASPFSKVDSAKVYIGTTGGASMIFPNAFPDIEYYIQLRHRNSIETWSSETINFDDPTITYDFSLSQDQAFGNNQILVNPGTGRYAIYNGDENQNGIVDLTDVVNVSNAANAFENGYVPSDMNGDNMTDLTDVVFTFNNANVFVAKIVP